MSMDPCAIGGSGGGLIHGRGIGTEPAYTIARRDHIETYEANERLLLHAVFNCRSANVNEVNGSKRRAKFV